MIMLMLDLDSSIVAELPVDELGLLVLRDFIASGGWNSRNYVLEAQQYRGYERPALRALSEAFAWLSARGLLAPDPDQSAPDAVFVTRIGQRVLEEGPDVFYATERLQRGIHPSIEAKARPQFLLGEYEQGVFVSMKAIEIRVRQLGGFGNDAIGVDLMNRAFGRGGPLVDPNQEKGEQEGTRALFAGAYGVFRNPSGHREVDYDDVVEAAEAVQTASLLMRLLDRIEQRVEGS
jgi:uncharacterized protein (TIGR02391 family)